MFFKPSLALLMFLCFGATAFGGDNTPKPQLGKQLTPKELAHIAITVFPSGEGLPRGQGTARQGAILYEEQCAACHGTKGTGGTAHKLAGYDGGWSTGASWPYATSIYDYVRRAMPPFNVKELSDDEVYALTAYILYLNDLSDIDTVHNQSTLPKIDMPAKAYSHSKWEREERHNSRKTLNQ